MSDKWYIEYYWVYEDNYDDYELYNRNTIAEVDFIESEIEYDRNRRILDVGCGKGKFDIVTFRERFK